MGLSLEIESAAPLSLDRVHEALLAEGPEPRLTIHTGRGVLSVDVHPAAEQLEVREIEGRVRLSVKTGTAGAGMHAWACELVDRIASRTETSFDVAQAHDPSDFIRTRDVTHLERYQTAFLSEVASQVLNLARTGHSAIALGMPDDVTFEGIGADGLVATPLGPRGPSWLRKVAKNGAEGLDILPWPKPGLDAAYFRGLALSLAWMEIRYRPPLDEEERALLDRVLGYLEHAHALEPEAPHDWSLWSELFELRGEESLRATRTHLRAEKNRMRSPVGYRRHPVTVQIGGGFRIRVPGELKTAWQDGGRVWAAWDEKRSLLVSTVRRDGAASPLRGMASTEATLAALLHHEPASDATVEHLSLSRGSIRGQAAVRQIRDDEGAAVEVRTLSAMGPHGALGTFVVKDPADQKWALEVWGTLDHEDVHEHLPS